MAYIATTDRANHEALRQAWRRTASTSAEAAVNAARFLHREHPLEAHQLLDRVTPSRKVAVAQGFFYAMDVLGMANTWGGMRKVDLEANARRELNASSNPLVVAAAAIVLPELIGRTSGPLKPGRPDAIRSYGRELAERARQLSGDDPALRGELALYDELLVFREEQSPHRTRPFAH